MKREELERHPAYLALSPDEQAEIDERLADWYLDAALVAATTGGVNELEAEDLRFWLATTRRRPWAMISTVSHPQRANTLFEGLLELSPGLAEREDRGEIVPLARGLCRALIVAEGARVDEGFIRDEQLAALMRRIGRLEQRVEQWSDAGVKQVLCEAGFDELAEALSNYVKTHRGVRGFLQRVGERLDTKLFDFVRGGLFVTTGATDHEGEYRGRTWSNWTQNYEAEPGSFLRPRSEDELSSAIAGARKLRVVGGGHSFNASPLCSGRMISLDAYDRILELEPEARRVKVQAGIRLRDLNKALWEAGLGLPVLGSTDAQSIGGLIATDLHGSGRDHGFLSEQVRALRIIAADGEAQTVEPGDELFHAAIGAIGTCGVVAEVELELVERYHLEKITEMVDRSETEANIDKLLAANEHLSFYYVGGSELSEAVRVHRWNRTEAPLSDNWEKLKTRKELNDFAISAYFPGVAKKIADIDEDAWLSDALAPDEALVMPGSSGFGRKLFYRHDELEYGVPFERYQSCLSQVMALLEAEEFFSIVEVRFTPDSSQALLGPGVGRRSAYIELATPLSQDHETIFARAETIMLAHGGQPHLGKKTSMTAHDMLETFGDRFTRFTAVRTRQDPQGKFLNAFCDRVLCE